MEIEYLIMRRWKLRLKMVTKMAQAITRMATERRKDSERRWHTLLSRKNVNVDAAWVCEMLQLEKREKKLLNNLF